MLDWEASGWPPWEIYRPVFAAAVARQLPIEPANLTRADLAHLRACAASPACSRAERARLALEPPLPPTRASHSPTRSARATAAWRTTPW